MGISKFILNNNINMLTFIYSSLDPLFKFLYHAKIKQVFIDI